MSALAQALPLALAAAFYPPAIVIVILLLTGDHPRRLVLSYLAGAVLIVVSVGVAGLFVLQGTGATEQDSKSTSAGVDIALGILLLAFAWWAWRRRLRPPAQRDEPAQEGRIKRISTRATTSVKWAVVLGIVMYLPSPFYLAAIKAIADSGDSDPSKLGAVLICAAAVMLFVEIPAIALVLGQEGLQAQLQRFNAWLSRNAWTLIAVLAAAVGAWLLVSGIAAL
ncbi:MAG: GAP family protein [Solirubrobacteraceae bacterium]